MSPKAARPIRRCRGGGGAPSAPLPLPLLWYIPIRAQLRHRGVSDILLADYAATLPVVFAASQSQRAIAQGVNGMEEGWGGGAPAAGGGAAEGHKPRPRPTPPRSRCGGPAASRSGSSVAATGTAWDTGTMTRSETEKSEPQAH